ncbi:MAG: hypothetical protein HOY79_30785 [Streptomyces sp.]|nr:hypothetical protein [Streptomyces sp.]
MPAANERVVVLGGTSGIGPAAAERASRIDRTFTMGVVLPVGGGSRLRPAAL